MTNTKKYTSWSVGLRKFELIKNRCLLKKGKNERIDELEAEVERLRAELTERDQAIDQILEEHVADATTDNEESQPESMQGRMKRVFGKGF